MMNDKFIIMILGVFGIVLFLIGAIKIIYNKVKDNKGDKYGKTI